MSAMFTHALVAQTKYNHWNLIVYDKNDKIAYKSTAYHTLRKQKGDWGISEVMSQYSQDSPIGGFPKKSIVPLCSCHNVPRSPLV